MMKLVIAEKPSVGMAYASVLGAKKRMEGFLEGNGYIVSWCFGHLAELASAEAYDEKYAKWRCEDLPIVPNPWVVKITHSKKKQFDLLRELMRREDVSEVINGCDAGREGELIFRYVYEQAGCKKPIKRLWLSSMEDEAIRDGSAISAPVLIMTGCMQLRSAVPRLTGWWASMQPGFFLCCITGR